MQSVFEVFIVFPLWHPLFFCRVLAVLFDLISNSVGLLLVEIRHCFEIFELLIVRFLDLCLDLQLRGVFGETLVIPLIGPLWRFLSFLLLVCDHESFCKLDDFPGRPSKLPDFLIPLR